MRSLKTTLPEFLLLAGFLGISACSRGNAPSQGEPSATPSTGEEALEAVEPSPLGPECGRTSCNVGDVCCNASCGICTPPDGMCTQQVCLEEEPAAGEPTGITCVNVRCASGTHCEMVEVQCIRAPCNPVPQCTPHVPSPESGASCGQNTCAAGQECCNQSCGICTDPGKGCIKLFCPDGRMPGQK